MRWWFAPLVALTAASKPLCGQAVLRCIGQGPVRSSVALMSTAAHPGILELRVVRLDSATVVSSTQARIDDGAWVGADSLKTLRVMLPRTKQTAVLTVRAIGYWAARKKIRASPDSGVVGIAVLEPGLTCFDGR